MREDRQIAAYEQLVREMEKLVELIQESQQNQHAFMQEAYRVLSEQSQASRSELTEYIKQKMQEAMEQGGAGVVDVDIPTHMLPGVQPGDQPMKPPQPEGMVPMAGASDTMGQMMPDDADMSGGEMTGGEMTGGEMETFAPQMMPAPEMMPAEGGALPTPAPLPTEAPISAGTTPAIHINIDIDGEQDRDVQVDEEVQVQDDVQENSGNPEDRDPPPAPKATAQVRFLHASPDAPGVDVYVDNKKLATGVAYEGVSPYLPLAAGKHRLQVFPAGKMAGALIDASVDANPNQHYTIVAAGFLRDIRAVVIPDRPHGGKKGFSRLKVVHLSPNAPAVDVTLPSGKVLLGHLTFKKISPYLQVTPGTRDLQVRKAGGQQVLLPLENVRFDPDITYTLYVVGTVGRDPELQSLLLPEA